MFFLFFVIIYRVFISVSCKIAQEKGIPFDTFGTEYFELYQKS